MPLAKDGLKICTCCKIEKSVNEFGKLKSSGDGLNYNCKDCTNSKARIKRKKFKKNNPEAYARMLEYGKEYKEKNKERVQQTYKEKYKRNKTKIKIREHLKRTTGYLNEERLKFMLDFFDNKCAYTGEAFDKDYIIEHLVPIDRGGYNLIWNIVPTFFEINASKSKKEAFQWYSKQEYFDKKRWIKIAEWQCIAYEKYKDDINRLNIDEHLK